MDDARALHEGNRDAWDRTARAGYIPDLADRLALLRGGGTSLMPLERRMLGRLRGRAVHLQCSYGLDTLSLLGLGAESVVGLDISAPMLEAARAASDALGAPAEWIRADVLDAPRALDGAADLVHTGRGALPWMLDLDAWAAVVARLLRPGGRLFVYEGHPLDAVWDEGAAGFVLREGATYFPGRAAPEPGFPRDAALRADPRPLRLTSRAWTLGETVTAVVGAGLRIERLEESPEPFWDQFKAIPPETLGRLPHTFGLLARKPL